MDKTRLAGKSFAEYFGLSSRETISIDDAVNNLVKELTGQASVFDEKSLAFDTHAASDAAIDALLNMHGWEGEIKNGQQSVSSKIKDARNNYLKQAGIRGGENLAAEFDEKLTGQLAQKLSTRMRQFYCDKAESLKRAFQNGNLTRFQFDQEMVHFLREVVDPVAYSPEIEVENALRLIGDKEEDVVDGLFYLFRGELRSDLKIAKNMELFEGVLKEITSDKRKFSSLKDSEAFRRKFIAKAREELAKRLPEPDRQAYLNHEAEMRKEFPFPSKYENYRKSMFNWLIDRPMEKQLDNLLHGKSDKDYSRLLSCVIKESKFYNHKDHSISNGALLYPDLHDAPQTDAEKLKNEVLRAAYNYVDSKPGISTSNRDKYQSFLAAAKMRLLALMPETKEKIRNYRAEIRPLLKNNDISKKGFDASMEAYLLSLVSPAENSVKVGSPAAKHDAGSSNADDPDLKEIVKKALPVSIVEEKNQADTLEALILCWGGSVNSHRSDFNLGNFAAAKSQYFRGKKHKYGFDPNMTFRAYSSFAVAAREPLVEMLSPPMKEDYKKHEEFLSGYLKSGHITWETYREGMELFLRKKFKELGN